MSKSGKLSTESVPSEVAMKILGISGSARVWGNCESAIKTVLFSAAQNGASCKFIRLTDLRIEPCKGCFRCITQGGCPLSDDLEYLLDLVSGVDAMVMAVPVYFMVPSSQLIRLLDRLLVMGKSDVPQRPAITITLMGNSKWRGVAESIVNMTASLLGFEVVASVPQVAEGPGEVLLDSQAVQRLRELGEMMVEKDLETRRKLRKYEENRLGALRSEVIFESRRGICGFCRSDFFRIEGMTVVCPICGNEGDLSHLIETGDFESIDCKPRWGTSWLRSHIASWIKPSIERYRKSARQALSAIGDLRKKSEKVIEDIEIKKQ